MHEHNAVAGLTEVQSRLPRFPDGATTDGSRSRDLVTRAVAVLALTATAVYLGWRAVATIDLAVWWVSIPLYVLELHAALGLGLYTFSLWDVHAGPTARPVRESPLRFAVLIPTWNEPLEVLAPTIAAAVALQPVHETWILDDGDRPHVARLADDLGARYLRRNDRSHAKAGNLNHALGVIEADIVAVLDADHVARPNFLVNTLGYFDDPRAALVQTPQDFYNLASFEHSRTAARDGFNEQVAVLPGHPGRQEPLAGGVLVRHRRAVAGSAPSRSLAGSPPAPSPRISTPPSDSMLRVGAPSTTMRPSPGGWRPPAPASTCYSATVGGPAPCRSCERITR